MSNDAVSLRRILIADDHTLFRRGLALVLEHLFEGAAIDEAGSVSDALKRIDQGDGYDLILLDLSMPGMESLDGLATVLDKADDAPVAILSAYQDSASIRAAIDMGARGYLLKSFSEDSLRHALALILDGEIFVPSSVLMGAETVDEPRPAVATRSDAPNPLQDLTKRQNDVLMLIMKGQSNKTIACSLGLYESTVKAHIQVILQKLQAENRTHAAMIAAEWAGKGAGSGAPRT